MDECVDARRLCCERLDLFELGGRDMLGAGQEGPGTSSAGLARAGQSLQRARGKSFRVWWRWVVGNKDR